MAQKQTAESFSKWLIAVQIAVTIGLSCMTFLLALLGRDASSMSVVAAASFVGDCFASAFYFWKAKNENRSKYAMKYVDKIGREYGIDAACQIAAVVLKD